MTGVCDRSRFWRFQAVGGLGLLVQVGLLWFLVRAGVPVVPATAFAVGLTLIHNFVWHTRWTWRTHPLRARAHASRFGRFVAANGMVSIVGNVAATGVLVHVGGAPVVLAQLMAVGACGLLNFWLTGAVVFRPFQATRSASVASARRAGGGDLPRAATGARLVQ